MLGSIAVEKEIYACETAQICVRLHVGEVVRNNPVLPAPW